ncbi:MAG: hypothetical protein Q8O59_02225 [bacterium]|nr:hypothetical protein [bacterium]
MTSKEKGEQRIKNERKKMIATAARRMKQGTAPLASSTSAEVVASPPDTPNHHGEVGVVLLVVRSHADKKVRRLAGQYVKVLPETAENFTCKGMTKVRVSVIPLDLPNPEQVVISMDYIRSNDPIVNGLRK